ncbi:thioester reductase domain-containing protein [Geodermatophilus marinus]|uniref:thioester reductase domain-containing protein n=1 Tax=Geodermatophilus sp. LHW52908 TaxID=2303986 RepID=UPI0013149720|nr:thioester reductase domain-containing protein [Geodermatophilus sp. LHW52908]
MFLTGATGFLGAFLLHELLERTDAVIHCLVRAATPEEARRRIEQNLASYVPDRGDRRSRVVPVVGDLSRPLLGLTPERFDALSSRVDAIYHNGAAVNWISSYTRLKPANVAGTQEVLRLACSGRVKPVHVVSSLAVFPLADDPGGTVVREQDSLDHGGVLFGGYTQSKWVAEKLVAVARSRGLPVAVYRPGIITGHSRTGAWNTDDFLPRLLTSWVELGTAPDLDGAIDMTPVDYVSRAMVHLSLSDQALGGVFHLVNSRPVHLRELARWIRSSGFPVRLLPYDRWRTTLLSPAGRAKAVGASHLLPLFSATPDDRPRGLDRVRPEVRGTVDRVGRVMAAQYAARSVTFDDRHARDGLAGTTITCPQVDGDVLARYLSYFVRTGFLHPPAHVGRRPLVDRPD